MNNTKRLISLILTAILIVSCLGVGVAVSAAPASVTISHTDRNKTIEVEAGQALTINIVEDPCSSFNAIYSFTNPSLFASTPTATDNTAGEPANNMFNAWNSTPIRIVCTISAVISSSASVGDRCVVNFTDCDYGDEIGGRGGSNGNYYTMSVTVVVKETPVPPSSSTSSSSTTQPTSSTTQPTSSSTTASTTTKPAPSTTTKKPGTSTKAPATKLDLTKLNEQIAAGEGLKEADYTADSWANFAAALKAAIDARGAKTQADIDAATAALKAAQAALVSASVDNTAALTDFVKEVKDFLEKDKISASYKALSDALAEAEAALAGGDKDQINSAYSKIKAAFENYKTTLEEAQKTEKVEVEKIVEVDPEGPFCNIDFHKLLLILLIISFILNLLFIALILYYFYQKKQKGEKKPTREKDSEDNTLIM